MALFVLGVIITVSPWLIHNYLAIGQFAFDDPRQLAIISSQYALTGNLDTSQFNIQSQSLTGNLIAFTLKHPDVVTQFIINHFLATEIGGVLALPLVEPLKSLRAPIDIYWFGWDGHLAWYNLLLVILYLAIIGIGLGAAWNRLRWLGLAPLAFSLGYAFANGIARFSGWRYDLPADWVSYFYFGIGVMEIISSFALLFGSSAQRLFTKIELIQDTSNLHLQFALPILAGFVLIGSLPWIAEHAVPPQLVPLSEAAIIGQAFQVPAVQTANLTQFQLDHFLSQSTNPNAEVLYGRLLYPRFFWRGQGIAQAHPSPAYAARDYSRLGFLLMMPNQIMPFVFPTKMVPSNFPNTGDVMVFGCKQLNYVETRVIIFSAQNLVFQTEFAFQSMRELFGMSTFTRRLLAWYRRNARTLPWRGHPDPYAVWVSEIMLQQTRVEAVIPYFDRWMQRFPTIKKLAKASEQDVLSLWEGLGYYSRARNLHKAAKIVAEQYAYQLPHDLDALRRLPGIGRYTVGAIASMAFDMDEPTLDGNIRRVLARVFDIDLPADSSLGEKALWDLAANHLPKGKADDYNQALMDLGSMICLPKNSALFDLSSDGIM